MDRLERVKIEYYFEFLLLIVLLFLVFMLLRSFFMALLFGIIFTFMFYKPYKYLVKKTKSPNFSAIILCMVVLSVILIPTYFIGISILDQSSFLIDSGSKIVDKISLENCNEKICFDIKEKISFIDVSLEKYLVNFENYIYNKFTNIFNSLPMFFLNFFIFLFSFYFLLLEGDKFGRYIRRIIPLKNEHKDALFLRFRQVSSAIFMGSLLVAIIQGILLGVGFWVFGLPSPIFWGIVTSFFALIPVFGTAIIWFPVFLFFLFSSQYLLAVAFFFWGAVIIGLSDNILIPYFVKKKIEVHPFLIFLSILGGIEVFGFLGIFIGPIIISLLISLLHLYQLDFN